MHLRSVSGCLEVTLSHDLCCLARLMGQSGQPRPHPPLTERHTVGWGEQKRWVLVTTQCTVDCRYCTCRSQEPQALTARPQCHELMNPQSHTHPRSRDTPARELAAWVPEKATSSPGLSQPAAAVAGVPCPKAATGGKLGAVEGNLRGNSLSLYLGESKSEGLRLS